MHNNPDVQFQHQDDIQDAENGKEKFDAMEKALILSVAIAASVGGTATIIGSSTNLVTKGQADQ